VTQHQESDSESLSDLDLRVDELLAAIGQVPHLDALIAGISSTYVQMLAGFSPDDPASVDGLGIAPVWKSLAEVAFEIYKLRLIKGAIDGGT
jgi:hypothetical protein